MVEIYNLLNQPVLVNRGKATPLNLLAGGRAVLDEDEAKCPHVQMLVDSGVLRKRQLKQQKPAGEALAERRAEGSRRPGGNESTTRRTEG